MIYAQDENILILDMVPADARTITEEEITQGWDQSIEKYESRLRKQAAERCPRS